MFGLNKSPVIPTSKPNYITMSFPEAIKAVMEGKKISRVEWNDPNEYGLLKNAYLTIHTKGKDHQWIVSDGDMKSIDWIVLP